MAMLTHGGNVIDNNTIATRTIFLALFWATAITVVGRACCGTRFLDM